MATGTSFVAQNRPGHIADIKGAVLTARFPQPYKVVRLTGLTIGLRCLETNPPDSALLDIDDDVARIVPGNR